MLEVRGGPLLETGKRLIEGGIT